MAAEPSAPVAPGDSPRRADPPEEDDYGRFFSMSDSYFDQVFAIER